MTVDFLIRKFCQRIFEMGRENGGWVEFYSTPFVFLTDTFTGEVSSHSVHFQFIIITIFVITFNFTFPDPLALE